MITKSPPKRNTGVSLDQDVTQYLDDLARATDRSRSWLINAIIRRHAQHVKEAKTPPIALAHAELSVITT